jgi:hypothetical protein
MTVSLALSINGDLFKKGCGQEMRMHQPRRATTWASRQVYQVQVNHFRVGNNLAIPVYGTDRMVHEKSNWT